MINPRIALMVVGAFATIMTLTMVGSLFETNDAGYVQIKQEAGSGNMSVRLDPGVYPQMFAGITTYQISDVYDFNGDAAINVQFNDGSNGTVGGQIKFRLPVEEQMMLRIHQDFKSYDAVKADLVRQIVTSALRQTASMFPPEEVYSTRRSDFIQLVNEQIKFGIYATTFTEQMRRDEDGSNFMYRAVSVRRNAEGKPIIAEPSTFKRYGIELIQLVINDIQFDEKTNELIAERKKADQQKVVAKANAERAKQDAITAEEQGKANVALAEAEALVEKKKAVIAAEKEKEVAAQQALQAEEQKKAIIAKGEAEAEAARLKVAAGLTPLDKANIEKETAIGVAEKLSKIQFPQMMVLGGGGNNTSPLNPFDAVGLKSFIDISNGITEATKQE